MKPIESLTRNQDEIVQLHHFGLWGEKTLADYLHINAFLRPEKEALVDWRYRITYREYELLMKRTAYALYHLGIRPYDRVALCLPSWAEFPIVRIAVSQLGAYSVMLNISLGERELQDALERLECKVLIGPAVFRDHKYTPIWRRLSQRVSSLELILEVGSQVTNEFLSFDTIVKEKWEERFSPEIFTNLRRTPDEVDDIMLTSGTTGRPKFVMSCQNRWLCACANQKRAAGFGPDDIGVVIAPVGGTIGYLKSTVLAQLIGGKVVLLEHFSPHKALELIEREKATYAVTVPTQVIKMLEMLREKELQGYSYNMKNLRVFFNGGAYLSPSVAQEIQKRIGCFLLTGIGSTETGVPAGSGLGDPDAKQIETTGRAYSGSRINIMDNKGVFLNPGQIGELVSSGSTYFDGYYDDPEGTHSIMIHKKWIKHGDLAWLDEEGYVHYVGRRDDLIIRGGQNISPLEIEQILMAHPDIVDVAVVRVPDPVLGHRVGACVVPKKGAVVSLEVIQDYLLNLGLARHKIPERLMILNEFPLSPGGKTNKKKLESNWGKSNI